MFICSIALLAIREDGPKAEATNYCRIITSDTEIKRKIFEVELSKL